MQKNKGEAGRRLAEELGAYMGLRGVILISPQDGVSSGFRVGWELRMPVEFLFESQVPVEGLVVIVVQDEITNGYVLGRMIEGLQEQHPTKVVVAALSSTRRAAAVLSYIADEMVVLEIVEGNAISHPDPVPAWLMS